MVTSILIGGAKVAVGIAILAAVSEAIIILAAKRSNDLSRKAGALKGRISYPPLCDGEYEHADYYEVDGLQICEFSGAINPI